MRRWFISALALTALPFAGCSGTDEPDAAAASSQAPLAGTWRAVLASPGGDLPFRLVIREEGGGLRAEAVTGGEAVPLSSVRREGERVVLEFAWYDSEITAAFTGDSVLRGEWRKTVPGGDSRLPFTAYRGAEQRFLDLRDSGVAGGAAEALPDVSGIWRVEFTDQSGTEPARGELRQKGEVVVGTFLTPTGDYRFLEGSYDSGLLRLSAFDGAHAFLFHARAQGDGALVGDFWSRDSYHATWTAQRVAEEAEAPLPDAWTLAGLTNDQGRFSFRFPDLDGRPVSLGDERFGGKVVLVNIFGSWCPNCNDEAPLLARWHRRFRDQGLEVVGLAYEFSGDPQRDRVVVERFADRYGIEYPLLLAGTSDKAAAAETLPDLTAVVAFPTTIFIGRDGKVRRIHSGFSGPGTGEHFDRLVTQQEALITELLAEPAG